MFSNTTNLPFWPKCCMILKIFYLKILKFFIFTLKQNWIGLVSYYFEESKSWFFQLFGLIILVSLCIGFLRRSVGHKWLLPGCKPQKNDKYKQALHRPLVYYLPVNRQSSFWQSCSFILPCKSNLLRTHSHSIALICCL